MESIYCDSHVVTMPEGDAISYTMKPTRMYPADEVADLVKSILPWFMRWKDARRALQSSLRPIVSKDLEREIQEIIDFITELEQIVEESA